MISEGLGKIRPAEKNANQMRLNKVSIFDKKAEKRFQAVDEHRKRLSSVDSNWIFPSEF